jgi:chromosome segregation ATPase
MIVEELYDALIEAGASEAKARAASRAIADMEAHFAKIRDDISRLDQKISELRLELRSYVDQRFTQIDGTLRLHNWMLGTILAFVVALFLKQFSR